MTKQVTILGATGSIGCSTLDVISRNRHRFSVFALTAHKNYQKLLQQAQKYQPKYLVIVDAKAANHAKVLAKDMQLECEILSGKQALVDVVSMDEVDMVMAAIVGAAGLPATLAAAKAGKRILLANKEALVMAGQLLMQLVEQSKAMLLPVDSEHNAIFQCLPENYQGKSLIDLGIRKIILTASGGAFLTTPLDELRYITPEQACKHPNWNMGRKITVDSASMMNKGLELIEAHWLFNAPVNQLDVLIQPQSIIHSIVEYIDGSFLAQMGMPDMRTPIANVMGLPDRIESGVTSLDFLQLQQIKFVPLEQARFPLLSLAYEALHSGKTATTCLNAANEEAVSAFLEEKINFVQIPQVVEQTLNKCELIPADSIDNILVVDKEARRVAKHMISAM